MFQRVKEKGAGRNIIASRKKDWIPAYPPKALLRRVNGFRKGGQACMREDDRGKKRASPARGHGEEYMKKKVN